MVLREQILYVSAVERADELKDQLRAAVDAPSIADCKAHILQATITLEILKARLAHEAKERR